MTRGFFCDNLFKRKKIMDMISAEDIDFYFKDILTNNRDFIGTISQYDDKVMNEIATKLLLSLFVNERGIVNDIQQENANTIDSGIKKKYKDFNPEHVMGYQVVRQKGKIKVLINKNKPFKVCSTIDMDMEKTMKENNLFREFTNRTLEFNKFPKIPYEIDSGMEVVTTASDKSKYLYNRSENSLYFKGTPPILTSIEEYNFLKKATPSEIAIYAESRMKNEAIETKFFEDEETFNDQILTFEDCVTCISNAVSHNNQIDKGEYLLIKRLDSSRRSILISKSWLKAVAETLIKSKDQLPSTYQILEKIAEYEAKNGDFKLEDSSIRNLLTSTFTINDNALDFMSNLIVARLGGEVKKDKTLKPDTYFRLANLINLYQENFNVDRLDMGISFPSKPFIYLMSIVGNAQYKRLFLDDRNASRKREEDYYKTLGQALQRKADTAFSLNSKTMMKGLQTTAKAFCHQHQSQIDAMLPFYHHGLVYTTYGMKKADVLQEDMENAIIFSALSKKINNAYEAISLPISVHNKVTNEDQMLTEKEMEKLRREYNDANRASRFILNDNPSFFDDFKLYVNGHNARIYPENRPYTFSRNIGQIRNSYSHSAVSLVVDNDGKTKFMFNDLRGLAITTANERMNDDLHERKCIFKLKCEPLKMFDFFTSGLFDSESIPVPAFFDRLYMLNDLKSFDAGKKTASFDSKGMTIINNNEGQIDYNEISYDSPEWKDIDKLL